MRATTLALLLPVLATASTVRARADVVASPPRPQLPPEPHAARTLTQSQLQGTTRLLLVFAPSAADARLAAQLMLMRAQGQEAAHRDLVTLALPLEGAAKDASTLTPADAHAARVRFQVQPGDFAVILIGKDGGEKLRDHQPVPFARLASLIDAMPMRRAEVEARARGALR